MTDVQEVITRVHRAEWARVVATLARRFGDLDLAEEMAAEAPVLEVADQPGGVPWLFDLKKEPVASDTHTVAKTYGEARDLVKRGEKVVGGFRLIGEDYTFCDKYVAKYGQNVPVWSNFEFKHHGFQGNFWTYLNRLKDAGELLKHEDGVVTRVDGNVSSAA